MHWVMMTAALEQGRGPRSVTVNFRQSICRSVVFNR